MFWALLTVLAMAVLVRAQYSDYVTYIYNGTDTPQDPATRKVQIDFYYESLCPSCINVYNNELIPVMDRLSQYIDLRTYPYGMAKMYMQNGMINFKCQHGDEECYGNKLHACAIEQLGSGYPSYWHFNGCLMSARSNDNAADVCARIFNINPEPIKACARGIRGTQLLKYYGDESARTKYTYVPYTVIDGQKMDFHTKLMTAVCNELGIAV